ncbi:hypothetical protein NDA01_01725 [Trichocoleus desertorum AS-A10]|uniref:DUF6816 family protein n=1 Tax=Trichocoleus desertorum TaxID=1481672 RepID=UPI00329C374C
MKQWSFDWRNLLWCCLSILIMLWQPIAQAGPLGDRIAAFPQWQEQPPVQAAKGDLVYPEWLAGNWDVTSTLVDLVAPLAPEVITPGFESNRQYLQQPVQFRVRFAPAATSNKPKSLLLPTTRPENGVEVVADRAFNGLNIAKAYLGDRAVLAVKVDPHSPNRQITLLRGDRQLISIVTGRATETPQADQFITTEVFQQQFRGAPQLYFNQVETTTSYQKSAQKSAAAENPAIVADQITAVYLSPQDPDYFKAGGLSNRRPVALYRYRLDFFPASSAASVIGTSTVKTVR